VSAWFERDVDDRSGEVDSGGCVKRRFFGVRPAESKVPTFRYDLIVDDDDAADRRVGFDRSQTSLGESQRPPHERDVGGTIRLARIS
jgi:hypothetical protein